MLTDGGQVDGMRWADVRREGGGEKTEGLERREERKEKRWVLGGR